MIPPGKQSMIKTAEIQAKSVLNASKIFDYCVNCYTGCAFNCRYCYASLFMRRYSGHAEPWGAFVDVKINAPEVLARQVKKAKRGVVWLSSVCDAYQPLEETYLLTRRCLEILAAADFPAQVQTKSVLVLCDIDVFKKFREIKVGFSIATRDERTARLFEPGASPVGERIRALGALKEAGVRTFAFVGPILPGDPEALVESLDGKADEILIDRMNYIDTIKSFYVRHGLEHAMTDRFFAEQTRRLTTGMKRRGMDYEVVFRP
jgi:DNA repair photolyase